MLEIFYYACVFTVYMSHQDRGIHAPFIVTHTDEFSVMFMNTTKSILDIVEPEFQFAIQQLPLCNQSVITCTAHVYCDQTNRSNADRRLIPG